MTAQVLQVPRQPALEDGTGPEVGVDRPKDPAKSKQTVSIWPQGQAEKCCLATGRLGFSLSLVVIIPRLVGGSQPVHSDAGAAAPRPFGAPHVHAAPPGVAQGPGVTALRGCSPNWSSTRLLGPGCWLLLLLLLLHVILLLAKFCLQ